MSKFLNKLGIGFFTGLLFFLGGFSAVSAAEGDLSVNFGDTPLFEASDLFPGDEVDASFDATNNTEVSQNLFIQFIKTDDGDLGTAIYMEVSGNGTTTEKTLDEWFDSDPVPLGSLAGGGNADFDLRATFDIDAGNSPSDGYQNNSVTFSVCVGLTGADEVRCSTDVDDDDTNDNDDVSDDDGGTGGTNPEDDYDGDGEDNDTDTDDDNDGTADTDDNDAFDGEVAGAFNSNVGGGTAGNAGQNVSEDSSSARGAGANEKEVSEGGATKKDIGEVLGATKAAALAGITASDFTNKDTLHCLWIFLVILVLIAIATLLFDFIRDAKRLEDYPRRVYRIVFIDVLFGIALLVAILVPYSCIITVLAVIIVLVSLYYLYLRRKLADER